MVKKNANCKISKVDKAVVRERFGASEQEKGSQRKYDLCSDNRRVKLPHLYSTVTDLARLRGQSTLHPRSTAMW